MAVRPIREAIVPAYLFLCLILGGSAQGIWVNALLQILAVALLAWTAATLKADDSGISARWLLAICTFGLIVILLQLIPLPPAVWKSLPGRDVISDGYALLGQQAPWMTLSLTPDETLSTLIRLLPPAAILAAMLRLKAYRPAWLAWALLAGMGFGVILGVLQVTSGGTPDSPWYLYPITNFGIAVGFFANGNHMAILLVTAIPFIFALLSESRRRGGQQSVQRRSAILALACGIMLVVIVGLFLNKSLAGIGLGLPVLAASAVLLARPEGQKRLLIIPAATSVVAIGMLYWLPTTTDYSSFAASTSVESRRAVAETAWKATTDFLPLGSGFGSFEDVYRLYEKPEAIDPTYVNHAHNDYLELAVEGGIPAVLWIIAFLSWWAVCARNRWTEAVNDPWARTGTIASAAILAHSLVDFPLRTTAISAVFAVSVALMAQMLVVRRAKTESDIRPPRHLEIR